MNKIGFGIVGYGSIAKTHIKGMSLDASKDNNGSCAYPRMLVTTHPEKNKELPFEIITHRYEDLIQDKEVDIVDICTPNDMHYEYGMEAMTHGKGVYMEKPLSHRLSESKKLMDTAMSNHIVNQTAFVMRFYPGVNRLKDFLDSKLLGEIIHFKSNFYHGSYLDPMRPISWRQQNDRAGGGSSIDLLIHHLDVIRYLMGDVAKVSARMLTVNEERYTDSLKSHKVKNDTDEYTNAMLELKNGAIGTMESSRVSTSCMKNESLEIFGTKGSVYLDLSTSDDKLLHYQDLTGQFQQLDSGSLPYEEDLKRIYPIQFDDDKFTRAHIAAIINVALWKYGKEPFIGTPKFQEAYEAQRIVSACQLSAKEQRWINLEQVHG